MSLLEAARLVDQALEDATNRVGLERRRRQGGEAREQTALALRVVHGKSVLRFESADLEHQSYALVNELEELGVHRVDRAAECLEVGFAHGRESRPIPV